MKIAFLGDCAFIGKYNIIDNSEVFKRLASIKKVVEKCDYVVANLEAPFTQQKYTKEFKSMPLKSNIANVEILRYLGVNAVSLANNHSFDYGKSGLEETTKVLTDSEIDYFGIQDKTIKIVIGDDRAIISGYNCFSTNGWYYSNLPENGIVNTLTRNNIDRFINIAGRDGMYPIAFVHWGDENTHYPKIEHVKFGSSLINNEKISVIGHHPHVIQGYQTGSDGIVAYSIGNMCFDDCESKKNRLRIKQTYDNKKGFVCILNVKGCNYDGFEIHPFYDEEDEIKIAPYIMSEIEQYSSSITNIDDIEFYEQQRKIEMLNANISRLGKRDINWIINHLNFNSVGTRFQRHINEKRFKQEWN